MLSIIVYEADAALRYNFKMQITLLSCVLSIILLTNAEATKETATPESGSVPAETQAVQADQPIITSPPHLPDVELKQRADSDYSDFIGFYSVSGYCMCFIGHPFS